MADTFAAEGFEPSAALVALREVETWIDTVEMPEGNPPLVDRAKAVSAILDMDRLAQEETVAAAFQKLPSEFFDHQMLPRLKPLALSIWAISNMVKDREVFETRGKLPPELAKEGNELRTRLFNLVNYYLDEDEKVGPRLADIRSSVGYLDLAHDLARLAQIVRENKAILSVDRRHYTEGCEEEADKLSEKILQNLNASNFTKKDLTERYNKIWALACEYYSEIHDAGKWLFRHSPIGDRFVKLAKVVRKSPSKKKANDDDAEAKASTENKETAASAEKASTENK